ncbi:MAG: deoxyribonuclease IV [Chloroflexota bacterium]|nr:deoxyribonuclease IV [Chloroflexota bacterium]
MHIGRHVPTSPRPTEALRLTQRIGADALQIFVTNPRGWRAPAPRPKDEEAFRALRNELGRWPVVIHAAYLVNLASPNDEFFEKSVENLRVTLERAALYDAGAVVFHIGSHTGSGEEAGLRRLTDGVHRALDGAPEGARLLLENDVGGGGKLGARFENIAAVLDALPQHADRLGVCLDTAHLWGAGFDISGPEGVATTLAQAQSVFDLKRVHVVHLNDSRGTLASHRDHHARLGEGTIPMDGLRAFLRAPQLAHATVILETPLSLIGDGPDGGEGDETKEEAASEVDWDAERRRIFQACELAGGE